MTRETKKAPVIAREEKITRAAPLAKAAEHEPKDFGILQVALPPMDRTTVLLIGTAPLLVHAWSQKARGDMRAKQTKTGRTAREAKDPQADFEASRYKSAQGWDGVPAGGLRACLIDSARYIDGPSMTALKGAIFIEADDAVTADMPLVRIYTPGAKPDLRVPMGPVMDERPVHIGNGMSWTTDLRYRARYDEWALLVRIRFMRTIISFSELGTLVATAGMANGLCEHRPSSPRSKTGQLGTFRIGDVNDAEHFGIKMD